jgi:hypothetical protein
MLGFKLEMPRREGSVNEKIRPIYLDMQVRASILLPGGLLVDLLSRLQHLLTPGFLTPCFHTLLTSMATLTVGLMRMDGKLNRPSKMLERYILYIVLTTPFADLTVKS